MFYYIYKIVNILDQCYYIGKHKTNNLNDNYYGSSVILNGTKKEKGLFEILGKDKFKKEILYFYKSENELNKAEKEIVNETILNDPKCYNKKIGGAGGWDHLKNTATIIDKNGKTSRISIFDDNYINKVVVGHTRGKFAVIDNKGNKYLISKDDPKYINGNVISVNKGYVYCINKNTKEKRRLHKDSEEIKSGEWKAIGWTKNDSFKGKKHSKETKEKIGKKNSLNQKSEKNSMNGKCWIYNEELKINKVISKIDLEEYLLNNWMKGKKQQYDKNYKKIPVVAFDKIEKTLINTFADDNKLKTKELIYIKPCNLFRYETKYKYKEI